MPSHRSRLCGAFIDVPAAATETETAFWAAALDRTPRPDPDDPEYICFGAAGPGVSLDVQSVGDDRPRVHFDIETDDVAAEVARLEAIGATVVDRVKTWVVMRDPVGIVFCVVRVQNPAAFETAATAWGQD